MPRGDVGHSSCSHRHWCVPGWGSLLSRDLRRSAGARWTRVRDGRRGGRIHVGRQRLRSLPPRSIHFRWRGRRCRSRSHTLVDVRRQTTYVVARGWQNHHPCCLLRGGGVAWAVGPRVRDRPRRWRHLGRLGRLPLVCTSRCRVPGRRDPWPRALARYADAITRRRHRIVRPTKRRCLVGRRPRGSEGSSNGATPLTTGPPQRVFAKSVGGILLPLHWPVVFAIVAAWFWRPGSSPLALLFAFAWGLWSCSARRASRRPSGARAPDRASRRAR